MSVSNLRAAAGDLITASHWNQLLAACLAPSRLRAGPGIRIRGTVISAPNQRSYFIHPWLTSINGSQASVSPGLLNLIEPTIKDKNSGDVPISGKKKDDGSLDGEIPKLEIADSFFDSKGRSYICVEPTFDDKWMLKSAKIVQVADLLSEDGLPSKSDEKKNENHIAAAQYPSLKNRRSRYPLARLTKSGERVQVDSITYFNLQVIAAPKGGLATSEKARFYFFPA